ncbi:hypothetical protein BDP27DRAFT_1441303 [Rhodocollybia butyracea]|uniref:DUF6533 domain-containing protein n=1 Tax=Rhodocollybia butyracea TaxID=206335 RepID=A0A9P5UF64_9AGAR|nr:hypothetical protein BDP27DRAFT_1441303 [Rhodocollybia butyracea]
MVSKAATHYLEFDIQWASIALIWYDYALTFPMEVQYLWTSKIRLSTFLYVLCRYALLANILYLLAISGELTENCNTWYQFIGALSVLGRAAVICTPILLLHEQSGVPKSALVVFISRTWAVWGKNRLILVYMSILGVICIALDIAHVPGLRCTGSSTIPIANDLLSILMIVFEFSSAILNSFRCIQAFRVHRQSWEERKKGFQYMLFEQGIFYFSVMSLITTAAVILNFQAPDGFAQRLLNALLLPLSGLLTARLLLHLREWESKHSPAAIGEGDGHANTNFTFRAASVTVSAMIYADFGGADMDPVARRLDLDRQNSDEELVGSDTSNPDLVSA